MLKKIKNNKFLNFIIKRVLYFFIKTLFYTYRFEYNRSLFLEKNIKLNGIYYFWHQHILSAAAFFFRTKATGYCIISPSKDGQIAGYIAEKLGFKVLYGSSHKNSLSLIKNSLKILREDKRICLVGDGSRGPAFKLQNGINYLACKSCLPVIYVECRPMSCITLKKTWDKFRIPIFFTKIYVKIHQPKEIK